MSNKTTACRDDALVRPAPWVSWVPGSLTVTLFDDRDGSYHALNPTASMIWAELGDGARADDIGNLLAARHPNMAAAVKQDVAELIADALRTGLLVTA